MWDVKAGQVGRPSDHGGFYRSYQGVDALF